MPATKGFSVVSICEKCAECCKRYYITLLPSELSAISQHLGLSEEEFISRNCSIMLQIFPCLTESLPNAVPGEKLSKFSKTVKKKAGYFPSYFLLLPAIALKKKPLKKCVFLDRKNHCSIYPVRPKQCALFPFISLEERHLDLKALYPFCKLVHGNDVIPVKEFNEAQKHYDRVKRYFKGVEEKGFSSLWKSLPKECMVLYKNDYVGKMGKKDFLALLDYKKIA